MLVLVVVCFVYCFAVESLIELELKACYEQDVRELKELGCENKV